MDYQLGLGHNDDVGDDPGEMPPPDTDIGVVPPRKLCAGTTFTCILTIEGKVKCWGTGRYGELGNENSAEIIGDAVTEMPPPDLRKNFPSYNMIITIAMFISFAGLPSNLTDITCGERFACVIDTFWEVRCWGRRLIWSSLLIFHR